MIHVQIIKEAVSEVDGSGLSAKETHMKFSKIILNVGFDADLHQQLAKASPMREAKR